MDEQVTKSEWYSFDVCRHCLNRLSSCQVMYANGTCAYCGYTCGHTVTDYKKITVRQIKTRNTTPLWKFWKPWYTYTYEGSNQVSMDYLNRNKKIHD